MERRLFDVLRQMKQSPSPMRILRNTLAGLCVAALAASAQTTNSTTTSLTLEECLQTALQHNFDIQIVRYTPQIARYNLNGSYAGYDPTFSLSGEHDYRKSPNGVDAQGRTFTGTESDIDTLNTGLRGLLPWGMIYDLGGSLADRVDTRSIDIRGAPVTYFTNTVYDFTTGQPISTVITNYDSVSLRAPFENTSGNVGVLQLRQPVLKNFWLDSTRLNIVINKRNLKISDLSLRNQVMNTVSLVEEAYYNLIFAEENVKVQTAA